VGISEAPDRLSWLLFNERPQTADRPVPLIGDLLEATARLQQAHRLQLPDPLAPAAAVLREPGIGERMEMLCDRLMRNAGSLGEARDRE
jgi:hypothetical protein